MAPGGGAPGRAGGAEGLGKGWGAQRVSPALPREGRQAEEQTWKMLQGGDGVGGTGCGTSYTSPCVGLRVPLFPRYPRGQMASTTSNTAANSIRASLVSPGGDVPKPRGRAALALERMGSARTQPRQHRPGGGAARTGCCHPRRARGGGEAPSHATNLNCRSGLQPSPHRRPLQNQAPMGETARKNMQQGATGRNPSRGWLLRFSSPVLPLLLPRWDLQHHLHSA